MEAYLDNSATTKCFDEVKDIVVKTMTEDYGNPSAMHLKGVEAEKYVKEGDFLHFRRNRIRQLGFGGHGTCQLPSG